jgi:hypothetical protein
MVIKIVHACTSIVQQSSPENYIVHPSDNSLYFLVDDQPANPVQNKVIYKTSGRASRHEFSMTTWL